MKNVLPIALKNKRTLLIGAGEVAAQKYRVLLDSDFEVIVVAREIKSEIFKNVGVILSDLKSGFLHSASSVFLKSHTKPCETSNKTAMFLSSLDCIDIDVIIDASGDESLSRYLFDNRKRYGFLLNVVDVPQLCDFYFGAIVRSGSVAVMVSTNGASPILAQTLRDKIARILPRTLGNFSNFLKEQRLKITWHKKLDSKKIDSENLDSKDLDFKRLDSKAQDLIGQDSSILTLKERENIKTACLRNLGKVFIIGCGPGDFSSLTLKAYETLQLIDVALIDNLVSPKIWEFLESMGVECISVGKQKGGVYGNFLDNKSTDENAGSKKSNNSRIKKESYKQDSINDLMAKLASEGKCVGRLKGGDPVIFGRVGEECSFLKAKNIEVECISGLSSSLCGALSSGILPTLRGISSGVLIVSAHLRESVFHTQWLHWLKDSPYTLIVMMAYSFATRIMEEARVSGIDLSLPAAFISKVDSAEQKSVIGTLGDLEEMANICDKPAILIIGKAVEKSLDMPYFGERVVMSHFRGLKDLREEVAG